MKIENLKLRIAPGSLLADTLAAERGHSCPQQCACQGQGTRFKPHRGSDAAADRNVRAPLIGSWLALVLALLGCCSALGQSATGPDVLRATLTNGLSVIIVRNTLAPVVTTVINYRVGSDECPPG